jgi:hypothetical protein
MAQAGSRLAQPSSALGIELLMESSRAMEREVGGQSTYRTETSALFPLRRAMDLILTSFQGCSQPTHIET